MTIYALINDLHARGIELSQSHGQLNIKAPKGAVTADIRTQLVNHKADIIAFLQDVSASHALPPITRGQRTAPCAAERTLLPLSYSQERLWFIDNLQERTPEYNMPMAFEVNGELDLSTVKAVFNTIIERHEVLRTVYISEQGETSQCIRTLSDCDFDIQLTDLSHLTGETLAAHVHELVRRDITTPFNLAEDLMLRVSYIKQRDNQGVMIFNMHHIASDGWSLGVLTKEFFTLYNAYSQQTPNPLSPLDIQYADFAHWQRTHLTDETLESQLDYWQQHLADLPALHGLPLDHMRPDVKQHQGAVVTGQLSGMIAQRLLTLAKQHQLTPFMLLHSALSLLLSRHSNSRDVVVGTPVANRLQPELEPLIGFFVNTLVLRVDTQHNTLSDYFAHIRQVNLDAQANQNVPFEQLVERLKVPRSNAHSPLFQIMLTSQGSNGNDKDAQAIPFQLPNVEILPYQSDLIQSKFDLSIDLHISEQGVGLHWNYDVSLFNQTHIEQLNTHLCRLLEGMSLADPAQSPHSLPLLSSVETQHLIYDLNDIELAYEKEHCVHELFEQQAAMYPDNIAVVFEETPLTYQQLNDRANQLAHYLKETYAITPDTLIGLCVERSLEMVIGILGILKAGGAYVPLDPTYPSERLDYMRKDADLKVVLSLSHVQHTFTDFEGGIVTLDGLANSEHYICQDYPTHNLCKAQSGLSASNLAYVIYTSGSTGQPKGVLQSHHNVNRLFKATEQGFSFTSNDCWCLFHSVSFDFSVWELWGALFYGGKVIILTKEETVDTYQLIEVLKNHGLTVLNQTPSAFRNLVNLLVEKDDAIDSLRYVVFGGEALSTQHVSKWFQDYAYRGQAKLINMYGITETTVHVTYAEINESNFENIHIGKALADQAIFILDENQNLVPFGCVGEAYVAGNGLALGYLNRTELTAERFIDNPFFDERQANGSTRLYRTGDLVRYLPSGDLAYAGRTDDQVKIRGFRIELGEIEHQLALLNGVDSAQILVKDLTGSKQLVGYVKPSSSMLPSEEGDFIADLKEALAQHLPEHMVPSFLIVINTWPLTANGKIDRKALPDPDGSALQGQVILPTTRTEQGLANIWAQLLHLDAKRISIDANFFDLGGHSLLSIRLVSDIRTQFEVEVSVQSIFETASLQALAHHIDQSSNAIVRPPLLAIPRETNMLPVSFAQQRLWFIDNLQGQSPEYNMPMVFKVKGTLNIDTVKAAINTILARHEVLRTVYVTEKGITLQHIRDLSECDFDIQVTDLTHLTGEMLQTQVKTLVERELSTSFNLAEDVMLRGSFVKTGQRSGVMIMNMHHIASDGWSLEVLCNEFVTLYEAYSHGESDPLPELAVQYADYARWQRDYLVGDVLESQLSYWEQQLAELPVLHGLPLDYVRPAVKQHRGAVISGHVSSTTAKKLLTVARQHQLTPFMFLHGVLSLLLSRHSNNTDIVVGTPVANRLQSALEPLIGFFVNTLVLRTNTQHASLADYFAHVRQVNLDAQSNQDVPFEQLVERLKISRSTAHSPLFQIMLTTNTDYGLREGTNTAAFTLPEVSIERYQSDLIQAKFDLQISADFNEDGVDLQWTYDVSLFSEAHVAQLNDHLCRLLEAVSEAQFTQMPQALPLLSAQEVHHLLYDLNDTAADYPKDQCIHGLFEAQVVKHPNEVAVLFEGDSLTYRQLNDKANQLAHYLRAVHHIAPGSLVGVCVGRSIDMVIGILGVLKAGGAYVPLDPNYPRDRLSHMIEDASLTVILSQRFVQDILTDFDGAIVALDGLADSEQHLCADYGKENPSVTEVGLKPSDLAYVIYTSGSTGLPKGVQVEHANTVAMLNWGLTEYTQAEREVVLASTSLNFDLSIYELFLPLSAGTKLRVVKNVLDLASCRHTDDITLINTVPSAMDTLLTQGGAKPHLKVINLAGEALKTNLVNKLLAAYPGISVCNLYGPSEDTTYSTSARFHSPLNSAPHIGQVITNSIGLILDGEQNLVPYGAVGELYLGGDGLTRGYLNRPELTKERFIDNPFFDEQAVNSAKRLYKTGDLVRYSKAGDLEFLGRADDQVKIRGFRIEVGEVETQLSLLEPVESALVMAKEVAGSLQLVGYVKSAAPVSERDKAEYVTALKALLGRQLPEYMIPSVMLVVEQWPLTPNGKIDRKMLPAPNSVALQSAYVAPMTDIEHTLVEIWAELLNMPPESISIKANFFELGGHSLLILKLLNSIELALELTLDVQGIYQVKDIQELAHLCDSILTQIQLKERLNERLDTELEEVEF
ncbi:hypothetical protein N480_25355 [Pseudoalteromonas luteoviolacea S2607]|uniref:non-ribosomal peptide synthetase n=1 Tax=Pseudoalteromonas luteoviolacea TaxID=43657 RepID=UPI0007B0A079|nr:non-ribosomal peptide synthetase [Pseudoalteromonas luteoviolacea]KZN32580.1 hypothetical protein N480_25355 [Pseudoalteromonas luteoviolacea S2607]